MRSSVTIAVFVAAVLAASAVNAQPLEGTAPDMTAALEGQTWYRGAPLTAVVEVELEGPDSALVTITNTSAASGSRWITGPTLDRVGFNLSEGPPPACLSIESEDDWWMFRWPLPVCGRCGSDYRFSHGFMTRSFWRDGGLAPEEAMTVRLRVKPECQGEFAFSEESFLDAPASISAGAPAQWAAVFNRGGWYGLDRGCARGDLEPMATPEPLDYTWASFVATAAELDGLPSVDGEGDTRAGSAQVRLNGAYGFDGIWTDPPYLAGYLTLRSGAGAIVEEAQLNRRWPPGSLDADGCSLDTTYPRCWYWSEDGEAALEVDLPDHSAGTNEDFDLSGERVAVGAGVSIAATAAPPEDAAHEWVYFAWTDPVDLATAQLKLRVAFDLDLDGTPDAFETVLSVSWAGEPDYTAPFIVIVEDTGQELIVGFDVQAAAEWYASL